jgi:hypothetical protein
MSDYPVNDGGGKKHQVTPGHWQHVIIATRKYGNRATEGIHLQAVQASTAPSGGSLQNRYTATTHTKKKHNSAKLEHNHHW